MALSHSPEEKELTEGDPVLRARAGAYRNHNNIVIDCSIALPHSPEEKELTEGDPVLRARAGAY